MPATRPASALYDPNDHSLIACDVFKRVQVMTQPLGGSTIAWDLQDGFQSPCPIHFFVDFGRGGTNEWVPLSDVPVIDGCMTIDPEQRNWDALADYYYRVRALIPCQIDPSTGECVVYLSQPQQANGIWSRRDWLLAKEISRKEYLMQAKRTNLTATGFLLKRRKFGVLCTRCSEFDTGESESTDCEECFGTGFLGGFFPAVDFTVTMNAPWARDFKGDPVISRRNDVVRKGRAVAYPYVESHDVFVRQDSGERFLAHEVQSIAEVGNIPVVVSIELRLAPVTDMIYRIPLSGGIVSSETSDVAIVCPPSSSSSDSQSSPSAPSEVPCDYRVGLDGEEDW